MSNELVPYTDIEKMGKAVSKSGLFGVKTEDQAIALMLVAQAYGKHPALAAMEYNIINNRPAKKAEAMLASFQEAGGKVKWLEYTDKKVEAEFSHQSGGTLVLAWTIEMAKAAGLVDKEYSNYKKYPRAMLRSRVVAEGVRAVYPAATGGMLSKEEAEDISDTPDNGKSRLDNIIEAELVDVKPEPIQKPKAAEAEAKPETKPEPAKPKKAEKKLEAAKEVEAEIKQPLNKVELKEGEKVETGFILTMPQSAQVAKPDGQPGMKHNFTMDDVKYGTFDKQIHDEIIAILDAQGKEDKKVLLHIVYKDRTKGDKTFHDIVRFERASAEFKWEE